MTFTNLKSATKLVWIGLMATSVCSADSCQQSKVDMQLKSYLKSASLDKLKEINSQCKSRKTRIALLIIRGDNSKQNEMLKSATLDYKEALALIEENGFKMFDKYRDYLKIELGIKNKIVSKKELITTKSIIDSKTLESYITLKSNKTRGANLENFSQVKGIPLNFRTGSATIENGYNLAQAKEMGKLLSKPKYTNQIIYITGYTDSRGSVISNKNLSQKRADGLKSYLVDNFHIKSKNLITESQGESMPICKQGEKIKNNGEYGCSGQEDYYKSRRVTLEYGE